MKKIFFAFPILFALIMASSCASSKQALRLQNHKNQLQRVAIDKNLNPEQKLDTLIGNFVEMMNEGLSIANPKRGAKYIKQYNIDNQQNIRYIIDEFAGYANKLDRAQKISMGVSMLLKPHIGDMIRLVPKFIRKYRRYKTALDITRQIKGQLLPFGIKGLGDEIFDKIGTTK